MNASTRNCVVEAPLVGRIDFLTSTGKAKFSSEFAEEEQFVSEIKDCLDCGIPICIVLYRNKDGKTISKRFVEDLDCLPAGFMEVDYPHS